MLSIEQIYSENSMIVYRYLLKITGNADMAEELTQETFYQALRCIDKFDESCKITTWLCAIAKNQLSLYLRKHLNTDVAEENDQETGAADSAEAAFFSEESRIELMKTMHHLPEILKEVIYMRVFGEMSFREIGEVMDHSENWARVTFYRAKVKLREEMNDDEHKDEL